MKLDTEIELKVKKKPFQQELQAIFNAAQVPQRSGQSRSGAIYDGTKLTESTDIITGGIMEKTAAELQIINDEVKESKKVLQDLYNEIRASSDLIDPLLKQQIMDMRSARMTVEREAQTMLTMMRDIRKFFLESDHKEEIQRLYEFVELCKGLQQLKQDGVLDAISDTILNLSVKK